MSFTSIKNVSGAKVLSFHFRETDLSYVYPKHHQNLELISIDSVSTIISPLLLSYFARAHLVAPGVTHKCEQKRPS
jgi:hypothetical protein